MIVFSLAGFLVQNAKNVVDRRRYAAVPSDEPSKSMTDRFLESSWSPVRRISDEEYRGRLDEQLIRIEADIALVDERIAKLESEDAEETRKS